jgi:predicted MFS family arabinose efflux permease
VSQVQRGRIATSLVFLLFGITLGTWTARIPAIKHGLDLSDGWLSFALLAFAAGAITGMQSIGRVVDRFGSRRVMLPAAVAEGLVLVPPALMPDLVTLCLALFVFGAVHGSLNIAMNANAIEVQRATGRPIISSFHAVYSIGGFLGASIGGVFAQAGLGASTTFVSVALAMVVLALWAATWAMPASAEPSGTGPTATNGAMPGVIFLGVLAFCALVGEGAAADWSAVYLRDSLESSSGFAAAAYAAFAIMMTLGRLVGDRLAARFGPVRLVRGSALLAGIGLGAALLVDHRVAGVAGFGLLGAGLSCIAPQVFSAAGNRDPAYAGRALARVASIGYAGFLTGPIVIGGASTLLGLPAALAIPVLLCGFVALTANALKV